MWILFLFLIEIINPKNQLTMSELNQENQSYQSTSYQADNLNDFSRPSKPDNNLAISIVGTVLGLCSPCCIGLILGIIAIVFSTQVDSKYNAGDYNGASNSAKNAKTLALISIALFAIGIIINIIWILVGGMDSVLNQYKDILDQIE
jgi:cytochrome c biogenesis protein CcdA